MALRPRQEWPALIEADPVGAYRRAFGHRWAQGLIANVPPHMHRAIVRYVILGEMPGDFLQAVLSNDLMESFARADDTNRLAMWHWCNFLHNFSPSECFRSETRMLAWAEAGGAVGALERGDA